MTLYERERHKLNDLASTEDWLDGKRRRLTKPDLGVATWWSNPDHHYPFTHIPLLISGSGCRARAKK
jgi:hypothetical protein